MEILEKFVNKKSKNILLDFTNTCKLLEQFPNGLTTSILSNESEIIQSKIHKKRKFESLDSLDENYINGEENFFEITCSKLEKKKNILLCKIQDEKNNSKTFMYLHSKYSTFTTFQKFWETRTVRLSNLKRISKPAANSKEQIFILPNENLIFLINLKTEYDLDFFNKFDVVPNLKEYFFYLKNTFNQHDESDIFFNDEFSYNYNNFFLKITSISEVESTNISDDNNYCIKKKKKAFLILTDENSSFEMKLSLFDDQTSLVSLLNMEDYILLYQPCIKIINNCFEFEIGTNTIFFCEPSKKEDYFVSFSQKNFVRDYYGNLDYKYYEKIALLSQLKPNVVNFSCFATVKSVHKSSGADGEKKIGVRISDSSRVVYDLTCYGNRLTSIAMKLFAGQLILIENLKSADEFHGEISNEFGSEILLVSANRGLLSIANLEDFSSILEVKKSERTNFFCTGFLVTFSEINNIKDTVRKIHNYCEKKILNENFCSFCEIPLKENEWEYSYKFFIEVSDGMDSLTAKIANKVAMDIIDYSPNQYVNADVSSKSNILKSCIGKEFNFSLIKIEERNEIQYTIESVNFNINRAKALDQTVNLLELSYFNDAIDTEKDTKPNNCIQKNLDSSNRRYLDQSSSDNKVNNTSKKITHWSKNKENKIKSNLKKTLSNRHSKNKKRMKNLSLNNLDNNEKNLVDLYSRSYSLSPKKLESLFMNENN